MTDIDITASPSAAHTVYLAITSQGARVTHVGASIVVDASACHPSAATRLAVDLLGHAQATVRCPVQLGPEHVPALSFVHDVMHPEQWGYAVTAEVRRAAARVLATTQSSQAIERWDDAVRSEVRRAVARVLATTPDEPRHRERVYLSGPMSGIAEHNFPGFNAVAARLRAAGFYVVNPAEINTDPTATWHECLRKDMAALAGCDSLALLPGWEGSQGAHLELHVAHRLGMRITTVAELAGEDARLDDDE